MRRLTGPVINAAVVQIGRSRPNLPFTGANRFRLRQEPEFGASRELGGAVITLRQQFVASRGELRVQIGDKGERFRREDPFGPLRRGREQFDVGRHWC